MKSPNISIIIPCLNEAKRLPGLLGHIKEAEAGHVEEIIVVDGGSSDGSPEIAGQHGATVYSAPGPGRSLQMNLGAEKASSEVLFFLHADTLPPRRFDAMIVNEIKHRAGAGCFRLRFDHAHPLLKCYAWFTKFEATVFRFGDQGLFVTAEHFGRVGGFREELVVMEDQQIVRDLKKCTTFSVLPESVVTSSRKYVSNGVLRLQLIFAAIVCGFYAGAGQETLRHFYKSFIRTK